MKRKILFVLNCMGAGGIAKSLSNLMFYMEKYKDDYEVDLFLFKQQGCYIKDIPEYVNVLDEKKSMQIFGVSQRESKKFGNFFCFKRFFVACWTKAFSNIIPLKIAVKKARLEKEYDLAVAFAHTQNSHDMACGSPEFVLYGVNAKKKCMVCHGDVVVEKLLCKQNVKNYKKFDKVYSVSKSCSEQVKSICPELNHNSDFLYNTQLNDVIDKKADEFMPNFDKGVINIVTAARLANEKAHLRFLPVLLRLHNEGYKFNYHILGNGILENEIKSYIETNNMNEYVKMWGAQSNPFPFVKNADLFALVSYYEAAPMVYNEAKQLQTPIFTTEIISSKEMVPEEYGFICDNNSDAMYEKLKFIFDNPSLIKEKKKNLKKFTYDNDAIVNKLLSLMN